MFIWILALIMLVTFCVINWAVLGDKFSKRVMVLQLLWGAAGILLWRLLADGLKPYLGFNEIIAFVVFVLVLCAGYYHIHLYRKRSVAVHSSKSARKRPRRHGRKRA